MTSSFRIGPCAIELVREGHPREAVAEALLGANVDRGPHDVPPAAHLQLVARDLGAQTFEEVAAEGEPTFFSGAVQAIAHDDGAVSLFDRTTWLRVSADGTTLTWELPEALHAEPRRIAGVALLIGLAVALRAHGLFHIHCGALLDADARGWLIGGMSGAGKTSTTVALLEAGLRGAGDDTAFLAAGPRGPVAYGLAKIFHPGAAVVAAHPRLLDALLPGDAHGDRRLLDPRLAWPTGLIGLVPSIDRLVFPQILPPAQGDEPTRAEPMEPVDALCGLIESAALVVVDGLAQRDANLALLQAIGGRARAVRLLLGRDALRRPRVIVEALARAGLIDVATAPVDDDDGDVDAVAARMSAAE